MLTNKWVLFALGIAVTLTGYFGTVDWNTYFPTEAGSIVMILGIVKMVLAGIAPPPSQTIIAKTSGSFFTHT